MDKRPYVFVFLDGNGWAFIAMNGCGDDLCPFPRTLPLEEWKSSSGTFYVLARICYTIDQAKKEMEKSPGIMVGPDMYTICNKNKRQRIATVWHPQHLPFAVDVDMNVPENDATTVGGNSLLEASCTFDNNSKEKKLQFWHVVNTK